MSRSDKFYITTSIPYLNAAPHLGFALEAVQADAIARFSRLQGKDVFFLSGADEHGAKIVKSAVSAGKKPKEFIDEQIKLWLSLLEQLGISNDDFIRTSDQARHWPGAEALWKKLAESGDLYKSKYQGFYCVGHEAFVTEKDLKNGLCDIHKSKPELIEEENYFFRLSKYAQKVKGFVEKDAIKILPESRKKEVLNMLKDAEDISFSRPSRDISWGVPVPGDATQTIYVWCDALSNYISALGYDGTPASVGKYWPADIHVIGKDILRFHAVLWPAMLMSANLPLPKTIFVHGFINIKGDKMSKTIGNVVDPFPLLEKYGHDAVRFYLLSEIPTLGDSDYSDIHFNHVYNGALANGLGNLLSRVLKMMTNFEIIEKPPEETLTRYPIRKNINLLGMGQTSLSIEELSPSFVVDNFLWRSFNDKMNKFELAQATQSVWSFLKRLDEYIEDYKPYKMMPDQSADAKVVLWNLAYSLASVAWMIKPLMPDTSERVLKSLGIDPNSREPWTKFSAKEVIHLFPKVDTK